MQTKCLQALGQKKLTRDEFQRFIQGEKGESQLLFTFHSHTFPPAIEEARKFAEELTRGATKLAIEAGDCLVQVQSVEVSVKDYKEKAEQQAKAAADAATGAIEAAKGANMDH